MSMEHRDSHTGDTHTGHRPDLAAIRAIVGEPALPAQRKAIDRIDDHCRAFIRHSPFLCLATSSVSGEVEVSPRGDQPGFVIVEDEKTLSIPDRPGNRLLYTHTNLCENPHIALVFFIPGMTEVLRVTGTAFVTDEPTLLAAMAVDGKLPPLAIRVQVDRAHLHCGRAALRGHVWEPASWPDTSDMPKVSQMLKDHVQMEDLSVDRIDEISAELYRQLY